MAKPLILKLALANGGGTPTRTPEPTGPPRTLRFGRQNGSDKGFKGNGGADGTRRLGPET